MAMADRAARSVRLRREMVTRISSVEQDLEFLAAMLSGSRASSRSRRRDRPIRLSQYRGGVGGKQR